MVQFKKAWTGLVLFSAFTLVSTGHSDPATADKPCATNIDSPTGVYAPDGTLVSNYTNFAPIVRNATPAGNKAFYDKYYVRPRAPAEARSLLASLYGKDWIRKGDVSWTKDANGNDVKPVSDCTGAMEEHIKATTPDVYIYVGGFGTQVQLNDVYIDAAEVVKWVNNRDPNALVISLGWSCDDAVLAGQNWCRTKALDYNFPDDHKVFQNLLAKTSGAPSKEAPQGQPNQSVMQQLKDAGNGFQVSYNESLTHSLEMSGFLLNTILVAESENQDPNKGKIHFIGYSLGAQIVTEIMTFDYNTPSNTKEGFPWSVRGVCANGQKTCRVADLKKVQWGLAMGTPGWTPVLRNSRNGFDEFSGKSTRDNSERLQYENGGLWRAQDATFKRFITGGTSADRTLNYEKKLVVFNKRYDPTGIADDTYQRGIGSSLLQEYNHYGHDYIRPFFWNKNWLSTVTKFVETPNAPVTLDKEAGIVWESGANFDFEDCAAGSCHPASTYAYHPDPGHGHLTLMNPKDAVTIVATDAGNNAVAFEKASDNPLQAYAMDQEDLRGSVEFSWKPEFDLAAQGTHGLFSYGSCQGSADELMPVAYVKDGQLVAEIKYLNKTYTATVDKDTLTTKAKNGEWAHIAVGWDIPTKSFGDLALSEKVGLKAQYGDGYFYAVGLLKAPRTSMRKQVGAGKLQIWVNGKVEATADIGDDSNERDCLNFDQVVNSQTFDLFDVANNVLIPGRPKYNPYQGYRNNKVPNSATGTLCKAYRVRNSPVFFGCAKSDSTNASAQMDNVRIVFGSPRTGFPELHPAGGLPKSWSEVLGI